MSFYQQDRFRIVLVSRFPSSINTPRGGVETATVGLIKALLAQGVRDLHIVTLEQDLKKSIVEKLEDITVHRLPRSRCPMFLDAFIGPSSFRLKAYINQLQPSIVHFHETWGFGSSHYQIPTIFTVHGFDSMNLPTEKSFAWLIRQYIWHIAEYLGIKNQNMLISIAPYVRSVIEQRSNVPIIEIWNSLDKRYFDLVRREVPHKIVFFGWLNPRKNPLILVEVARILTKTFNDLSIDLCGEHSDSEYLNTIKSRISQYHLESVIKLPGRISQTEVMQKLQQASVMVLPSLQENAPMVIAEAMAAGVPVIASNLCGIPDMIEHGVTGLLTDYNDPELIAQQITSLFNNDALRTKISVNAKKSAYSRYHPDNVANLTLNAYKTAIERFNTNNKILTTHDLS